jgi:hypothetical protein
VGAVGAEDEFPLQKDRLDLSWGKEKVLLREILVVLQTDF